MMQFPQLRLVIIQNVLLDDHSPSLFLFLTHHQTLLTPHAQEHPLVLSKFYELPTLIAASIHRVLTDLHTSLDR